MMAISTKAETEADARAKMLKQARHCMTPAYPKEGTQARRVLDILLEAFLFVPAASHTPCRYLQGSGLQTGSHIQLIALLRCRQSWERCDCRSLQCD
jgi:hypothetical protein